MRHYYISYDKDGMVVAVSEQNCPLDLAAQSIWELIFCENEANLQINAMSQIDYDDVFEYVSWPLDKKSSPLTFEGYYLMMVDDEADGTAYVVRSQNDIFEVYDNYFDSWMPFDRKARDIVYIGGMHE